MRIVDTHLDYITEANDENSLALRQFLAETGLTDMFTALDPSPTRNGRRIDYVFASPSSMSSGARVRHVDTAASDHAALVATFGP